jgi:hypothetical protein
MYPQQKNSLNKPLLVKAIQQMVEVHAELMRFLTQNFIGSDSKELPPGMQQVLDDHSRWYKLCLQERVTSRNASINNN